MTRPPSRNSRFVSVFDGSEDRALSNVVSIALMIGVALTLGGGVYVVMSSNVSDTLQEEPDADVSFDPGSTESSIIVHSTTNTEYMNVTVNGVAVSNETTASLPPTDGATLTFDDTGTGDAVDITTVDSGAWDTANNQIAVGTRIVVTATAASGKTEIVYEFEQPR